MSVFIAKSSIVLTDKKSTFESNFLRHKFCFIFGKDQEMIYIKNTPMPQKWRIKPLADWWHRNVNAQYSNLKAELRKFMFNVKFKWIYLGTTS